MKDIWVLSDVSWWMSSRYVSDAEWLPTMLTGLRATPVRVPVGHKEQFEDGGGAVPGTPSCTPPI